MYRKLSLLLLLAWVSFVCCRAQLLEAAWKNTIITSSGGLTLGDGAVTDDAGNSFLLVHANYLAEMNGQTIGKAGGQSMLVKTNVSGDALYCLPIINGIEHYVPYKMSIDNAGNVLIGGAFKDSLLLGDKLFAIASNVSSAEEEHAFLMKVNSNGELIWFREYPCTGTGKISNIEVDDANNIYAVILYNDSLLLPGEVVFCSEGGPSNQCIIALSSTAGLMWHHALCNQTNGYSYLPSKIYRPCKTCSQKLLLIVGTLDNMVIDGTIVQNDRQEWTKYLLQLTTQGRLVMAKKLGSTGNFWDIETVEDKVFVSGTFKDSIAIDDKILRSDKYSIYVAGFNDLLQLEDAAIVQACSLHIGGGKMKYIPGKGIVLLATYLDSFFVAGQRYSSAPYSYTSASSLAFGDVIMSLSPDLTPGDMRYMDGPQFDIANLSYYNDEMTLYTAHQGYNPITGSSAKNGITLIKPLPFMKDDRWPAPVSSGGMVVYPNPSSRYFTIRMGEPLPGYSYRVYNTLGQLVDKAASAQHSGNSLVVDLKYLPVGVYYLHLKNDKGKIFITKLVKTR